MNGQPALDDAVGASTTRRQFLQTLAFGVGAFALLGQSATAILVEPKQILHVRRPTALIYDEISKYHLPGVKRPECPQRYDAVKEALKKSSYFSSLKPFQSRPATDDEILACHSGAYLARVRREIESGASRLSTGDTWICRKSFAAPLA